MPKLDHNSTHAQALRELTRGDVVVDLGCGAGYFAAEISAKGCRVIGIDKYKPIHAGPFDEFIQWDLDAPVLPRLPKRVNVVFLLDVVEHLKSPEAFVTALRAALASKGQVKIVVSTGNVGFIVLRLMLLMGQFNYGKRGILDLTHTRLFTFGSLRRLFEESGFIVRHQRGIPAPIPLVVRNKWLARLLVRANQALIMVSPTVFAYQIYLVLQPLPTLKQLLVESSRRMDS
jgi:2-polyprenyl-3-methyl-5-hydroxy-6-metoxy-1,4-benzoquinol methylase